MRLAFPRTRVVRMILFGFVGAFGGCAGTIVGFFVICFVAGHTSSEYVWGGWSVLIFTISYGVAGEVYGAAYIANR